MTVLADGAHQLDVEDAPFLDDLAALLDRIDARTAATKAESDDAINVAAL